MHVLSYTNTYNLGDEIQSLAAIHTLKKLGINHAGFVDIRNPEAPKGTNLLINGFVPDNSLEMKAKGINLIFNNLHIHSQDQDILSKRIEILRGYQPIGCRDKPTTDLLNESGIESFFNYCLTLTFDRRKKEPINGKIFINDIYKYINLPLRFRRQKIYRTIHAIHCTDSFTIRMQKAQKTLDLYRDEAKLVITSRLHCALPCIAMGVPVILLAKHDNHRLGLAAEFIPIYGMNVQQGYLSFGSKIKWLLSHYVESSLYYNHKIDWDPQPLDIEHIKEKILATTKEQINRFT